MWSILVELQALRGQIRFESAHYLGYFFLIESLYIALRKVVEIRGLLFLQMFSAFFGAVAVALFYRFLRVREFSRGIAFLAAVFLATAPTFWKFSTTPEVYTLGASLLMAGLLLTESCVRAESGSLSRRSLAILLPVLGHQSLAMFGAAHVAAALRSRGGRNLRGAVMASLIGAAVFLILASGAYALSPLLGRKTFFGWLLGYVKPAPGEILVSYWGNPAGIMQTLATRPPAEISTVTVLGWTAIAVGLIGLFRFSKKDLTASVIKGFLILHFLFDISWDPAANEFWVYLVVPMAYGIACFMARGGRHAAVAAALVVMNAGATAVIEVRPSLVPTSNSALTRALKIRAATDVFDALVIPAIGQTYEDKVYVPYFAARTPIYAAWILSEPGTTDEKLARLERIIRTAGSDRRVLIMREMRDDPLVSREFLDSYGISNEAYSAFLQRIVGDPVEPYFFELNHGTDTGFDPGLP